MPIIFCTQNLLRDLPVRIFSGEKKKEIQISLSGIGGGC